MVKSLKSAKYACLEGKKNERGRKKRLKIEKSKKVMERFVVVAVVVVFVESVYLPMYSRHWTKIRMLFRVKNVFTFVRFQLHAKLLF